MVQRLIPGPLVESKAVEKAYDEKMNKMALNFEKGGILQTKN